jgi:TIR domain
VQHYTVCYVGQTQRVPTGKIEQMRIFISHSSGDVSLVTPLVDLLRSALNLKAADIRCTSVDGYRLPAGAHTEDQLRAEVAEADAFIGMISPASVESMYVAFELGARWVTGKPLIPLLACRSSMNLLKGPLQGLNALAADSEAQLHQLVQDLASVLKTVSDPPSGLRKIRRPCP